MRLRHPLKARVSDRLAAVSAVLLLVTALSGFDPAAPAGSSAVDMASSADWESAVEQAEDSLSGTRASAKRGLNISLMIFRNN